MPTTTIIIEDDYYARSWMTALLVRDGRFRVLADLRDFLDLQTILNQPGHDLDILLLDAQISAPEDWVDDLLAQLSEHPAQPGVLLMAVSLNERMVKLLEYPCVCGLILKNEIRAALSWALALGAEGNFMVTPGSEEFLRQHGYNLPKHRIVIAGEEANPDLSPAEWDAARKLILFNLEDVDADIDPLPKKARAHALYAAIYQKIGVQELMHGKTQLEYQVGSHPVVLAHFKNVMEQSKNPALRIDQQMAALAFHILTRPILYEIKQV